MKFLSLLPFTIAFGLSHISAISAQAIEKELTYLEIDFSKISSEIENRLRDMDVRIELAERDGSGKTHSWSWTDSFELDGDTMKFMAAEMDFSKEPIKGAPYQAEVISEKNQYLPDGNRIQHRTSSLLARDSEGRTRQEHSNKRGTHSIFINDPVAGKRYLLRPERKTAMTLPSSRTAMDWSKSIGKANPGEVIIRRQHSDAKEGNREESHVEVIRIAKTIKDKLDDKLAGLHAYQFHDFAFGEGLKILPRLPKGKGVTSSLGIKDIEGVRAEGTRTEHTIAAGEIGNDRPITIVSEQWYSPDLKLVVLSRRSDPRSGETVYRLTNIRRSEPSAQLFSVPSDYTIDDPMTKSWRHKKSS